jgi:hypothetical protein
LLTDVANRARHAKAVICDLAIKNEFWLDPMQEKAASDERICRYRVEHQQTSS